MGTRRNWWRSGRGGRSDRRGPVRAPAGAAAIRVGLTVTGGASPRTGRPAICAHRGGALLWPENSLAAFRGALGLGVDLIECDVHQTRDGEVLVVHDPTLERTTTGRGAVRDVAWVELAAVTVRGTAGEPVPRLADVLALIRPAPVGLLLEIKRDPADARYPGIEERVLTLLRAAGVADRTTVMAFDWTILERLRALAAPVRLTGLLAEEEARRLGGVAPAAARVRALGADDLGVERTLLAPAAVRAARDAGLTIGVWTVNDSEDLRRALAAGIDYVTTDRPDIALRLRGLPT